jgi:hypothetical protein
MMDKIDEPSFMANMQSRFGKSLIYTYIGEVVVAVNPFRQLDIYGEEQVADYKSREMYAYWYCSLCCCANPLYTVAIVGRVLPRIE